MSATGANSSRSYVAKPPSHLFQWPIGLDVPAGPPQDSLLASYFDFFMDVRVPIAIAATYAAFVHIANHIRKTNKKPLAICNSGLFKAFVIAHNVGLCVYSAWTFLGMTSSIVRTVVDGASHASASMTPTDGFLASEALWLGSAKSNFWRGLCDLNSGIWENGLKYYGFFFYLSKFYEVLDTVIILAKGRQSSLLQTYHHAGAMLSMWAGIRYASPPIWIFVVFNSLIHTIMYCYYTLSTLKIPVPKVLKRALTTAQITQFVAGGSLAMMHLFVYYFNPDSNTFSSCLRDPGQTFALMFNVFYLAPLTYLFVMFWIESYARKTSKAKLDKASKTK